MKGKLSKIFLAFLAVVVVVICVEIFLLRSPNVKDVKTNNPISQGSPFFALAEVPQLPEGTFPEAEAGMSAYTDVGVTIDLDKVRDAFKTIEDETDEYIIGSVETTGTVSDDAHCWVHIDGWVVVYYSKDDPIAKVIYWWSLPTTKLEKGIGNFCADAGLPLGEAKHYDFRYPNTEKLMIITKVNGTFNLKIPSSYIIYERSYSTGGTLSIDNNEIGRGYGTITPTQLKPDVLHSVSGSQVAIILAY